MSMRTPPWRRDWVSPRGRQLPIECWTSIDGSLNVCVGGLETGRLAYRVPSERYVRDCGTSRSQFTRVRPFALGLPTWSMTGVPPVVHVNPQYLLHSMVTGEVSRYVIADLMDGAPRGADTRCMAAVVDSPCPLLVDLGMAVDGAVLCICSDHDLRVDTSTCL